LTKAKSCDRIKKLLLKAVSERKIKNLKKVLDKLEKL
jgi:hypothetical protein